MFSSTQPKDEQRDRELTGWDTRLETSHLRLGSVAMIWRLSLPPPSPKDGREFACLGLGFSWRFAKGLEGRGGFEAVGVGLRRLPLSLMMQNSIKVVSAPEVCLARCCLLKKEQRGWVRSGWAPAQILEPFGCCIGCVHPKRWDQGAADPSVLPLIHFCARTLEELFIASGEVNLVFTRAVRMLLPTLFDQRLLQTWSDSWNGLTGGSWTLREVSPCKCLVWHQPTLPAPILSGAVCWQTLHPVGFWLTSITLAESKPMVSGWQVARATSVLIWGECCCRVDVPVLCWTLPVTEPQLDHC